MGKVDLKTYFEKFSYLQIQYILEVLDAFNEEDRNDYYEEYKEECLNAKKRLLVGTNEFNLTLKWDRCTLLDVVRNLKYREILLTKDLFDIVSRDNYKNNRHYDEFNYLFKEICHILNEKIGMVKKVISMQDMTLDDFDILLSTMGSNNRENYAISFGIDEEELTPEIMYQKMHVKRKEIVR